MPTPYTIGKYETVSDPTAWQLWWEFNKDPYLLLSRINTAAVHTGDDDFFLGAGQKAKGRVGGRATEEVIKTRVVPAMRRAIELGGSYEFVQNAMLAAAKVGDAERHAWKFILEFFVKDENPEIFQTAAIGLGMLGGEDVYSILSGLARDTEAGRELATKEGAKTVESVDMRLRSFAAYGLGLVGKKSRDVELRRRIVEDLVALLEEDTETEDLEVSAMLAMGLVPLDVVEGADACYCGECEVEGPGTSLQAQVTYLMRYFTAKKEFEVLTRAHTATTLARLIEAQPEGMPVELKMGVAELLVDSLATNSREPAAVRQSSVLGLGLIGDADADPVDEWIRWALGRAANTTGPLERRFALMSLAQVGSRPGTGDEPTVGTAEVRTTLLHHLSRARKDVKPWAGLALGVLGHWLRENGVERDAGVDLALRQSMKTARKVDDLGAFAVAAGMRQDGEAVEMLLKKLPKTKDESAKGYLALGLGMIGDTAAVEDLEGLLLNETDAPVVQSQAGLALGLLGETDVVTKMLKVFDESKDEVTRAAVARALGFIGDQRSVDRLAAVVSDKETDPDTVRADAVLALGYVSDRAALPWRSAFSLNVNYRAETPTLTTGDRTGVLDLN